MPNDTAPAGATIGDAELVRRARREEPGAFDALFERHYPAVFNFALKMDGNRDNAADIAQTSFVRVYQALPRLKDGQAFLGFVYRIVINLVRDRARSERRKPWVRFMDLCRAENDGGIRSEPVELADAELNPQHDAIRNARDKALRAAILELPVDFREVLVLHHLQQMDVREVSEVVGVPVGTVKSRLGRARLRLRTALAEWVEGGEEP
jgi:RNA polymerase sigma-70 factor, ECF subfamily